jgi:hypothetical protein
MRSVIVVSLLLCGVAAGQATNTTTDQSVVQQAYAKAAYALQLTAVYDLYSSRRYYSLSKQVSDADVQAAVAAATVTFQITNIKTGLIGEIANTGILEMIGNPIHAKLSIHSTDQSYSKYCDAASKAQGFTCVKGSQLLAGAQWQPSPDTSMGPIPDMPLAQALQKVGLDTLNYTRYVTYTVRMQYQTQDVTYNALALFGGGRNSRNSSHLRWLYRWSHGFSQHGGLPIGAAGRNR